MFDLLKNKLTSFTEKLRQGLEGKVRPTAEKPVEEPNREINVLGEERKPEEKLQELRQADHRELKARVGIGKAVAGLFTGEVKIEEKDLRGFLEELELALLEADVEQETALQLVEEIQRELNGKKAKASDLNGFLRLEMKKALLKLVETKALDLLGACAKKKPFVVLLLGPNGAGKTTTIAKLTAYLQKHGKRVVWAASDTFRAASIEQLEEHAKRLGVRVVKHTYGADPAAVAFDAVKAAEAGRFDVVLIDSAGRQETNRNLMEELKKINRVVKPDLRDHVGEAYAGQALLGQATEFDRELGLDGFVLTKIDADAKGGTALSLLHRLRKPILFVGTGQRYEDLVEFKPEFIVERVIGG
ncbi:MAG TPA: signal recognition particle-docking protein FtsY [Candidatus Diapherotrites archaeon]|uniref:Signal recognition particle-docking protein FtsY n=1 Tax=Candidatus Iainarchaeum sp. TaxID=3101447 RepID=A0A7J4JFU8_9ARCH|nr:signal recognition particle-docking protein FtsY [Candidatus Diapherotrites archaeon]